MGFRVKEWLAELPEPPRVEAAAGAPLEELRPEHEAAAAALLGALGPCPEDGQRSEAALALGGVLRKLGAHAGVVRPLIEAWMTESGNVEDHVRRALDAWNHPAEQVSGLGALREVLGPPADVVFAVASAAFGARRTAALAESAEAVRPSFEAAKAAGGEDWNAYNAQYADSLAILEHTDEPEEIPYLVPELELGPGRPYGLIGLSNASKTLAVMQLCVDFAMGRPVWGKYAVDPDAGNTVLFLHYEAFMIAPENWARVGRAAGMSETDRKALITFGRPDKRLTDDDAYDWLCWVSNGKCLAVIDPFVYATEGLDENSAEIAKPLQLLERVSYTTGVTWIILHHKNKQGGERGSSAIQAALGGRADLTNPKDPQNPNRRDLECGKAVRYPFAPAVLGIYDTEPDGTAWERTDERKAAGAASWGVSVKVIEGAKPASIIQAEAANQPKPRERGDREENMAAWVVRVTDKLRGMGWVSWDSARKAANINSRNAPEVFEELKRRGVIHVQYNKNRYEVCTDSVGETPKNPAHGRFKGVVAEAAYRRT